MGTTAKLIVLLGVGILVSFVIGVPASKRPLCFAGSTEKRCRNNRPGINSSSKTMCAENDHECIVNSNIPGIEVQEVIPSGTTQKPGTVTTTTEKINPVSKPRPTSTPSGSSDCPTYPILFPSGSKNPNCKTKVPISQYGCNKRTQDPWCRYFTFMYLYGPKT